MYKPNNNLNLTQNSLKLKSEIGLPRFICQNSLVTFSTRWQDLFQPWVCNVCKQIIKGGSQIRYNLLEFVF